MKRPFPPSGKILGSGPPEVYSPGCPAAEPAFSSLDPQSGLKFRNDFVVSHRGDRRHSGYPLKVWARAEDWLESITARSQNRVRPVLPEVSAEKDLPWTNCAFTVSVGRDRTPCRRGAFQTIAEPRNKLEMSPRSVVRIFSTQAVSVAPEMCLPIRSFANGSFRDHCRWLGTFGAGRAVALRR